ncbi:MAG: class I SAM-dependent methyltransferase [Elusimicrobia bacterium]|nr:class I SAM-dependent methyltransferase [Elusimicrobiota bacterium]
MPFVPKDVVFFPESGRWVAYNVFARTAVGLDASGLERLSRLDESASGSYKIWDVEWFSNEECSLFDPTGYRREPAKWPKERLLPEAEFMAELKKHAIIADDEASYLARFAPKRNLADRERFGNFHQRLGQHLLLERREKPAEWWLKQKFTADQGGVRKDTLYGAVQLPFLRTYFSEVLGPGSTALDIGCGNGFYANLMAERGAEVLGVDPNEEYVAFAGSRARKNARFRRAAVGEPGALDFVASGSIDFVYMSDALLFYFIPLGPKAPDLDLLLREIARVLKPGGRFASLEPHGVFYLSPWLGAPERPFTIVSEYRDKKFGTAPNPGRLLNAVLSRGFALSRAEELYLSETDAAECDARAKGFAAQFPIWHLFEFRKA